MRIIGNDPSVPRQEHAVASGALTNGTPVVVNANGTVSVVEGGPASAGSATQFDTGQTHVNGLAGLGSGKFVIWYRDYANSGYGTVVVGSVSGSSISFGTPVVVESQAIQNDQGDICYDSTTDRVVVTQRLGSNSDYGTAFVGTVSGTSISFGSAITYSGTSNTYDNDNDARGGKIVIIYRDGGAGLKGTVIAGTISGSSITFGSAVRIATNDDGAQFPSIKFIADDKFVVAFRDLGNSSYGSARVGTLSGNSITLGSLTTFSGTNSAEYTTIAHDTVNDKIVIGYRNQGDSDKGYVVAGTVSGTSVSFGTSVKFNDSSSMNLDADYDASTGKTAIVARDNNDSDKGIFIEVTLSGTDITLGTELEFENGTDGCDNPFIVYDSSLEKNIVTYNQQSGSGLGQARLITGTQIILTSENYIGIARSGAADTAGAIIDTQGAIADNLTGLTAGQSYYVQTDGTLSTTADDPSVFAGTAVSATKLIVKG